jgi:hypothetical protein
MKIMEDLREKGLRRLRAFVEACERGQLLRIEIDEYGDELRRDEIGRCRRSRR